MTKKIGLLSIYCLLIHLYVSGQEAKWHLQFNQIASDKGLSEPTNHFVFNDSKGFTWISSIEGLNRYDGRRVKVYKSNPLDSLSLIDDNIQSPFFEDNEGNIWFTTVNGINCYRRKRDNFDRFTIKQNSIVPNSGYNALFLEQNHWLWIQVNDKLFKFDITKNRGHQSEFIQDLQGVRFSIDTFSNGKIHRIIACSWIIKEGIEIIEWKKNTNIVHKESYFTKENANLPPLLIQQALIESDTLIWLSGGMFLVKFNPKNPSNFKTFSPQPFGTSIRNLALSEQNELIVSTNQTPLLLFDKTSEKFSKNLISYSKYSKNLDNVTQLHIDKSNILWASTVQKGIFHTSLQVQPFTNMELTLEQFSSSANQIKEDKNGSVWVGFSGKLSGYSIFDNKKRVRQELGFKKSQLFQKNNGMFWCVTQKGDFYLYDFISKKFIQKAKNKILDIGKVDEFNDSSLVVGTTNGFLYFNTKNHTLLQDSINGISLAFQKVGDNQIWHDTPDGRIVCQKIDKNRLGEKIKETVSYTGINSFHTSTRNPSLLWVATAKGIVKINLISLLDTLYTQKDGLPSSYIQAILEDKKGNLWCSSNQGIIKYNPILKKSQLYTKRHGLSSDSYSLDAALLSSTGEMWFGGNNGVDVFHPDSIRDIGHAPQSAIVGLKIFDKYWKGETAIEVAERITLKHNENTLTLELAAMEYTDPENNRFKVALVAKGDTIQWTDLGTQNYVTYPNLREGSYTFMLMTANSEGIWNETPKTLVIDIRPPYWRTWWFLTLVALATMSLVGYIVYLRLSKVIALQKIRLNLYENLHDDIGSRLTAIVLSVDELVQRTPLKDAKLERIGTISKNIVANMRRLVWATAPENDALSTVVQQMQSDRRVLLPSGTVFRLTMDTALENLNIGGDKRYQMLSIFNEALTNIAKYADASVVETRIELKDQTLIMHIMDNGKGFDPDAPREDSAMSSGHGLRNMQRRAERIKGTLDMTSKIGEGTNVVLFFPMHDETMWTKFKDVLTKYHLK
jgi:ligand-binding sensor domain-containing protein/two-component sensor histidine kinase